jgi:hypothetical protein
MRRNNLIHLLLTSHENPTPVMDMLRLNLQHPLHLTIHRHPARILHHHSHGTTLIQDPQLPLGRLFVGWVGEYAAVQECSVGVGNHGANVPGGVGLAVGFGGVFEGFEVGFCLVGPVEGVSFINGVNGSLFGDAHVGMGEDELAKGVVLKNRGQTKYLCWSDSSLPL